MPEAKSKECLTYKGKPLVKSGNTIYYGDLADDFVVVMTILSTKTLKEMTIADKIQIQLMSTDPEVRIKDRLIKKSEKNGLYNALDISAIWLERALSDQKK